MTGQLISHSPGTHNASRVTTGINRRSESETERGREKYYRKKYPRTASVSLGCRFWPWRPAARFRLFIHSHFNPWHTKKKKKGLNVLCTKDCDISFFFTFIVLPFVSLYVSLVHSDDNSKRCISLSVTVHANAAPDIVEKDALTLRSLLDITCFTERVEGTLMMRGDFFLIN